MYISLSQQYTAFFYSLVIGVGLGVVYDIFRITRLLFPKSFFLTFFQDILFWIISLVVTFFFSLVYNNGELRLYIIIAEILGFLAYYFTFGRVVFWLFRSTFKRVKNFLDNIYKKTRKIVKKTSKNVKKPLQNG